jgi:hypothetical protein
MLKFTNMFKTIENVKMCQHGEIIAFHFKMLNSGILEGLGISDQCLLAFEDVINWHASSCDAGPNSRH